MAERKEYTPGGDFPINLDEDAYEHEYLEQDREPQSLGAELQERADTEEAGGDGGIPGKVLYALEKILGQDRSTRDRDQKAYQYEGSQLTGRKHYYIPPQDEEEYSKASSDMYTDRLNMGVMGTAGEIPLKAYVPKFAKLKKLPADETAALLEKTGPEYNKRLAKEVHRGKEQRLSDIGAKIADRAEERIPTRPYIGPVKPEKGNVRMLMDAIDALRKESR